MSPCLSLYIHLNDTVPALAVLFGLCMAPADAVLFNGSVGCLLLNARWSEEDR
jgi:hypothetical protein